ncbi:tetratricopeptide repeat protein [Nocardiopsis synnemataformans]|uniref:tetratricopeptide repeat protein n=1 Tax=Nocardiopsis synnemataformans TaxID=61305 RepID=UPI003EB99A14
MSDQSVTSVVDALLAASTTAAIALDQKEHRPTAAAEAQAWFDQHRDEVLAAAQNAHETGQHELALSLDTNLDIYLAHGADTATAARSAARALHSAQALGVTEVIYGRALAASDAHRRHGDHEAAITTARHALEVDHLPEMSRVRATYTLAMTLAWSGEHEQALPLYQQVIGQTSTLPVDLAAAAANGIAWTLAELGRAAEALPYATRALDLAMATCDTNTVAAAHDTLGEVHTALGDISKARSAYQDALTLYERIGYQVRIDQVQESLARL